MSVENASMSTSRGTRPRHSACGHCRAKKLKCSGDKPSCQYCVINSVSCIYPSPLKTRPRRSSKLPTQNPTFSTSKPNSTIPPQLPTPSKSVATPSETHTPSQTQDWENEVLGSDEFLGGGLDGLWPETPLSELDNFVMEAEEINHPHTLFPDCDASNFGGHLIYNSL